MHRFNLIKGIRPKKGQTTNTYAIKGINEAYYFLFGVILKAQMQLEAYTSLTMFFFFSLRNYVFSSSNRMKENNLPCMKEMTTNVLGKTILFSLINRSSLSIPSFLILFFYRRDLFKLDCRVLVRVAPITPPISKQRMIVTIIPRRKIT